SPAGAQPPRPPPPRRRGAPQAASAHSAGARDRPARGTLRDIRRHAPRHTLPLADLPGPRRAPHRPAGQADPIGSGVPPPHAPIARTRTPPRPAAARTPASTAAVRRPRTARSTGSPPRRLAGCCVGPITLMGIVYDPAYRGPIDAGDLGKCVSIFHVLAIVFAGTHAATEIRAGSTALSFLTQRTRWTSLAAQAAVQWAFLASAYVV